MKSPVIQSKEKRKTVRVVGQEHFWLTIKTGSIVADAITLNLQKIKIKDYLVIVKRLQDDMVRTVLGSR